MPVIYNSHKRWPYSPFRIFIPLIKYRIYNQSCRKLPSWIFEEVIVARAGRLTEILREEALLSAHTLKKE